MEDYDKRELGRLKEFERAAKNSLDLLYYVVQWSWVILILGIPILIYLAPIKEDRTLQAIVVFLILLFTLGLGKADKALGKITS